jgi:membrane protein DedA with SNARE-associated domain
MLTSWPDPVGLLSAGMTEPWILLPALVLTTFLLEDVAIAAGVALVLNGTLGMVPAFAAVAGGIALGDLGLFGLGSLAGRVPALNRWLNSRRTSDDGDDGGRLGRARALLDGHLAVAVLVARAVPGLRFVTYTASGLLGIPFARFTWLVLAAVGVWTAGLFWLGLSLGEVLERWFGITPVGAITVTVILLALLPALLPPLVRRRSMNSGGTP